MGEAGSGVHPPPSAERTTEAFDVLTLGCADPATMVIVDACIPPGKL